MNDPIHSLASKPWLLITRWGPVFLYCSLIVYLSSQSYPDLHVPSFLFGLSDKLVHAVEYGILAILVYRAVSPMKKTLGRTGLAFLFAVAFGISDEIHQWFVPQRHADIWDIVADALGAALFIVIWVFITEILRSRDNQPQINQ